MSSPSQISHENPQICRDTLCRHFTVVLMTDDEKWILLSSVPPAAHTHPSKSLMELGKVSNPVPCLSDYGGRAWKMLPDLYIQSPGTRRQRRGGVPSGGWEGH